MPERLLQLFPHLPWQCTSLTALPMLPTKIPLPRLLDSVSLVAIPLATRLPRRSTPSSAPPPSPIHGSTTPPVARLQPCLPQHPSPASSVAASSVDSVAPPPPPTAPSPIDEARDLSLPPVKPNTYVKISGSNRATANPAPGLLAQPRVFVVAQLAGIGVPRHYDSQSLTTQSCT